MNQDINIILAKWQEELEEIRQMNKNIETILKIIIERDYNNEQL